MYICTHTHTSRETKLTIGEEETSKSTVPSLLLIQSSNFQIMYKFKIGV